jgi:hypothetical protein
VFHVLFDLLQSKYPRVLDRILGRLPSVLVLTVANYGVNWLVNYLAGEIVKVQTVVTYKP